MNSKKYNWQHFNWPHFEYDLTSCQPSLYAYIKETARLSGALSQLPKESLTDALIEIMVMEALKTSEIEGEKINDEDIRSSLKNQFGVYAIKQTIHDERARGIAHLMLDVRETFNQPLTHEKLYEWHRMVMQGHSTIHHERGCFRTTPEPMQIVSGPLGRERVYFEAPPASQLDTEMTLFIQWFNETAPNPNAAIKQHDMCGPVRAAITHLYFESIHPFIDGNGRIGRALVEKALSQDLGAPVLYSISAIIQKRRKDYYEMLHKNSRYSLTVTSWVCFFIELIYEAQCASKNIFLFVLGLI